MQTLEGLHKLGEIDREMIAQRVQTLIQRRADGDIAGMLAYAAPDIVCYSRGDWAFVTFPRPVVGKEAVAEAYRVLNIEYENLGSTIQEILIDGDRVALYRTTAVRNRGTSKVHKFSAMNFIRFREGLIVEFSEYLDANAAAMVDEEQGR